MKNIIVAFALLIVGSISISLTSCEKNPFWVGKKEFLTISYGHSDLFQGPEVSSSAIDESPFVYYDDIFAYNTFNGTVNVVVNGVRVESNRNNFEIDKINIYEKDGSKFEIQSEFDNAATSNKNDIAAVLVLDMSTSLESLMSDLKSYAKDFVDEVVGSTDDSQVAVVFFSSKTNIYATGFYNSTNAAELKNTIDTFSNFQSRTALYEATLTGINTLDNLTFSGSKAVVIFTDGGDNDSDNPTDKVSQIQKSDYLRISIGLKGDDFDKEDLQAIASTNQNSIVVKKEKNLQKVFEQVSRQVISVYQVVYERSDQILEDDIEIKFEFEVNKIK